MVMPPYRSAMPLGLSKNLSLGAYVPTHDAVLSAVTMAVATDAMICTINFKVSFLLITLNFYILTFLNFRIGRGLRPKPLVSDRLVIAASAAGIAAATSISTGIAATALAAAAA